ncbi:Basic-leucine zipper domain-containing protein [Cynara cardunculus var. scolymus]|uniref:Basic-leucine zipper domain-containing protein n=1 Tax=Cynara cardunculus var. scolymus TaxID=59895 RepID=A0A103XSA8_CYNCS|nr:Basic-leucine zipper domain-containing protein [Cynara cardunculus var. scolymus]
MPPAHPQIRSLSPPSQIPVMQSPETEGSHSRSLSQTSFFPVDSLPQLSLSPTSALTSDQVVTDVSMEDHDLLPPSLGRENSARISENLPPRKTHRRSNSDIPFGFSTILQSSPPLIPLRGSKGLDGSASLRNNPGSKPVQYVKWESSWEKTSGESNAKGIEERKCEGEVVDDLFSAHTVFNNLDGLNSSRAENREDLDSRASGTKAHVGDGSDNEATSSVNGGVVNNMQRSGISSIFDKREGIKRSAGGDIAPTMRHYRSVSMDSIMGKMNFADELLKLPPSPEGCINKFPPSDSINANSDTFNLEFGNGMILANRQSAARSKERKMRYIVELENKVQTLQTETTSLSTQLMLLQRDSTSLTSQNNELKFRLQAMEQQAQLRDALNEALTADVQRLKIMTTELSGDAAKFSQLSLNPQMFQLHQQQQNGCATTTHE